MDAVGDNVILQGLINSSDSNNDKPKVKKTKKKRCPICNKKLGLLPYTCKCGLDFCVSHIQPELHNCKYDHKKDAIELLNCKMIKVTNQKIEKI